MQTQSFRAEGFDIRIAKTLEAIGIMFSYRTPDLEADQENLDTPRIIMSLEETKTLITALQRTVEAAETGVMPLAPDQNS